MNNERKYWLDDPRNVDKLFWGLCVVCGLLLAAELVIHLHPHFGFEAIFGFYAWVGFVSFFLIVLAGRALKRILHRPEDYYDHD